MRAWIVGLTLVGLHAPASAVTLGEFASALAVPTTAKYSANNWNALKPIKGVKCPGERAMVDSAMFYLIGTVYPLLARATYPKLGFPQYPGEAATSDADEAIKAQAQQDAEAALAEPLDAYRAFFLEGKTFIGGDTP